MNDNLIIPLLIAAGGLLLLVIGWLKRGKSQFFRSVPLRLTGGLMPGETQFLTGTAHCPVKVTAPASKSECVFYSEKVERLESAYSGRGRSNTRWVSEGVQTYGAFFLKDADGAAFVLPGAYALDLNKPEFCDDDNALPGMAAIGATRRTEQTIKEGETVTVLGVPRPLADVMRHLRASGDTFLPGELVKRLAEMEADPALSRTPCFFGDGLRAVTDRPHGEYVEGTAAAGANYLQLGALLLIGGLAALLYLLKDSLPSSDPY